MKKLKILVDARCIGGEGQGMLTYLVGLYKAMNELYPEYYELYFAGYDQKAMEACFPFLDEAHFIPLSESNRFTLYWKIFPEIIEELNIDFAHFQYITPFRKKCKHIVTTHDVLFLDFPEAFSYAYRLKRTFLFKRSLQKSDIRLTVSNYSGNRISDLFGIPRHTIQVTPNAVSDTFMEPYDKKNKQQRVKNKFGFDNYLLYVSRIEKRKNHQLLLKTYEQSNLAEKGIQLVLVGNDTLSETDFAEAINGLKSKYPGMVHWLPYVEETDLLDIYRAARLFVYPSLAEGFGIPPVEAAAIGLPTLCSNKTAMEDFDFFGENHFDPEDEKGFSDKLNQLLAITSKEEVCTKNRDFVRTHYSWAQAAKVLHQEIQVSSKEQKTECYTTNSSTLKKAWIQKP